MGRSKEPVTNKRNAFVRLAIGVLVWAATVGMAAIRLHGLQRLNTFDDGLVFAGRAIFLLIALFCLILFLQILEPEPLRRNSRIFLLAVIALLNLLFFRFIAYGMDRLQWYPISVGICLMPLAFSPIITSALIGSRAAIAMGCWGAAVVGLMFDGGLLGVSSGIVAAVATAAMSGYLKTRTEVIKTSLSVGLIQMATVVASAFMTSGQLMNTMPTLHQASAIILAAFFSGLLALLLLPALEHVFAITTDISLLELSDMGHPLLRRMAIEAPGTYHHSMIVASLAQSAAQTIGANPLLARVCSYFHDIGKLTKPDFFIENLRFKNNPHDELPPSMSTLVIASHVKEGVSLAKLYNLPRQVIDVIQEHHGNSLMSFFHQKARDQLEEDAPTGANTPAEAKLNEQDYRYQGPRPKIKESAIIALADSVEAASRTIEKVTPAAIENLVNQITLQKIKDGQMDQCGLTFDDLSEIRKSFVFILTSMLHERIRYPKDEDRDKSPQRRKKPDQRTEDTTADRTTDATGRETQP